MSFIDKHIIIICASLTSGGAERVISILVNIFIKEFKKTFIWTLKRAVISERSG